MPENDSSTPHPVVGTAATMNAQNLSASAVESQGVVNEALAHSLSLMLHNAGATQYAGSQTANAAIASVCAVIINSASPAPNGKHE